MIGHTTTLVLASAVSVLGGLLWFGVHLWGILAHTRAGSSLSDVPRGMALLWLISFAGGFTGPGIVPVGIVSIVLGSRQLIRIRRGRASATSRLAARTVVVSGVMQLSLFASVMGVLALGGIIR